MLPRLDVYDMLAPDLWQYVRYLMTEVSPFVMIAVAIAAVGILIPIIVITFRRSSKDLERDYEYQEY